MQEIRDHKDRHLNAGISIEADDPGRYGVSTFYTIRIDAGRTDSPLVVCLPFHEPWTTDREARGISDESLLAVLIDRLRGCQLGPLANSATGRALSHLQRALHALKQRPAMAVPPPEANGKRVDNGADSQAIDDSTTDDTA